MALLRNLLITSVLLVAVTAHAHTMGRAVPMGYSGGEAHHLAARVIAAYFEEQMGREVDLVKADSPRQCLESVRARKYPLAVLPEAAARELPAEVVRLQGSLGPAGQTVVLVMGRDARKRLEFSLVQRYLDSLTRGLEAADWEEGRERVRAGEGARGVALDMLREADLL